MLRILQQNSERSGNSTWLVVTIFFGGFLLLLCYLTQGCLKCQLLSPEEEREVRLRRMEERMTIQASALNQSEKLRKKAEKEKQRLAFVQKVLPHEDCLKDTDIETGDDDCAICLEGFEKGDVVTSSSSKLCGHKFHRECMAMWLVKTKLCPVCRKVFLFEDCDDKTKKVIQSSDGEIAVEPQDA